MRRAVLALALTAVVAEPVYALSCLRPNIARTFNRVAEAPDVYAMGLGRLEQTGPAVNLPPPPPDNPPSTPGVEQPVEPFGIPQEVPARFAGGFYGLNGLGEDISVEVTVDVTCLAMWCGSFPASDEPVLVFLKQTEGPFRLESGPCEGDFRIAPTEQELSILQSCLAAGMCTDAQVDLLEPH